MARGLKIAAVAVLVFSGWGCRSMPKMPPNFSEKVKTPRIQAKQMDRPKPAETPSSIVEHEVAHPSPATTEMAQEVTPSPPQADFFPKQISPLAPTNHLVKGPMPKAYEMRLEEMARLGKQLAATKGANHRTLRFDVVYNPKRAGTCHTEAGDILVTSALLERVQTRHQLAVALALEIAEHLQECERKGDRAVLASAGVPEDATMIHSESPQPSDTETLAGTLLAEAGFQSLDVPAIRSDIELLASADQNSPREPRFQGPRPVAAN